MWVFCRNAKLVLQELQAHINLRGKLSVKINQIKLDICEIWIFVQNTIDPWEKAKAFQSMFIATSSFGFLLFRQIINWSGKRAILCQNTRKSYQSHPDNLEEKPAEGPPPLIGELLTQGSRRKANSWQFLSSFEDFFFFPSFHQGSRLKIQPFNVLGDHFQHLQGKIC